jgi:hypothetical protein
MSYSDKLPQPSGMALKSLRIPKPIPFARAHCTGSRLLFVEHLYPFKYFVGTADAPGSGQSDAGFQTAKA